MQQEMLIVIILAVFWMHVIGMNHTLKHRFVLIEVITSDWTTEGTTHYYTYIENDLLISWTGEEILRSSNLQIHFGFAAYHSYTYVDDECFPKEVRKHGQYGLSYHWVKFFFFFFVQKRCWFQALAILTATFTMLGRDWAITETVYSWGDAITDYRNGIPTTYQTMVTALVVQTAILKLL
jgi:hypothetical protein